MSGRADSVSKKTLNILKFTGLVVPIIYWIYGLLILSNTLTGYVKFTEQTFFVIGLWWIVISLSFFFGSSRDSRLNFMRVVGFHALSAGTLLFVTGIPTIFSIFWIINVLLAFIYYFKKGLQLSILTYGLVCVLDIFLTAQPLNPQFALYNIAAFTAITLASLVIMSIKDEIGMKYSLSLQNHMLNAIKNDRFTVIINNLHESVISTDKNGVVDLYNAATLNLLDTNIPIKDKHIGNVLHLRDSNGKTFNLLKELERSVGTVIRDDLRLRYGKPEEIRVETTFTPIRSSYTKSNKSDAHDGYIVMIRDITKAKSLEEERDEFISVVSHELRTPVTVIEAEISNIQALMKHPDVSQKMKDDALQDAHNQIVFLSKMINDLSALSRAERGVGDKIEEVDVKDFMHDLYLQFNDSARSKKLKLNIDLGQKLDTITVSKLYLEELLQNLINNAIKYTKEGNVTISAKKSNDYIQFSVKDTGIGISKSDQAHVFEKFFRSEDYRTRETSGTGLGLYVSSKLARKIDSKIEMTSRLNHGTTFVVEVPINAKTD